MARVHVIGAGLAGLAAALSLSGKGSGAGRTVLLHEQSPQAGGRCRSWHEERLGRVIDNGNHLLLSANSAALAYLDETGARGHIREDLPACFSFYDLEDGGRWRVDLGTARWPAWLFRRSGRAPGCGLGDYLDLLPLLRARAPAARVGDFLRGGPLDRALVEPLCLAVMNAGPAEASAAGFAAVLRATLLKGGAACRPLLTWEGLGLAFVEPALGELARRGVELRFNAALTGLERDPTGRPRTLIFGEETLGVGQEDAVVLALPPQAARRLLPERDFPLETRGILNLHFLCEEEAGPDEPLILGLLGGTAQWVFRRGSLASVTVSAADALLAEPADALAARIWPEIAAALGYAPAPVPPYRVVKEKRATFAQTPEAQRLRPDAQAGPGLWLAGDWTATGYPATIEGAILSGRMAADRLLAGA